MRHTLAYPKAVYLNKIIVRLLFVHFTAYIRRYCARGMIYCQMRQCLKCQQLMDCRAFIVSALGLRRGVAENVTVHVSRRGRNVPQRKYVALLGFLSYDFRLLQHLKPWQIKGHRNAVTHFVFIVPFISRSRFQRVHTYLRLIFEHPFYVILKTQVFLVLVIREQLT